MLPVINIRSIKYLCKRIGFNFKELNKICLNKSRFYTTKYEKKKNRSDEFRTINAPKTRLKIIQRLLLHIIYYESKTLPDFLNGGVPERSILTNATPHVKKPYILFLDIEDFFDSISRRQIREIHRRMGFSPPVSSLLADLTTYDKHLPQGAPTSPFLANMYLIYHNIEKIRNFLLRKNLVLTTYVDDITISGDYDFSEYIPTILELFKKEGIKLNEKKTKYCRKNDEKIVTGVSVTTKINVPRKKRCDFIKQANHIKSGLIPDGMTRQKWNGIIAYCMAVNKPFGKTLKHITATVKF
ncbi:MAG: reverse transcriptase family protein [Bacteroidota bacterium]